MHYKSLLLAVSMTLSSYMPAWSTTIAFDGKTLACDSQSTSGHTKFQSAAPKIAYSPARHATIAAAGDVAFTAPVKKFFLATTKPLSEFVPTKLALAKSDEWLILVINDDGEAFLYNHSLEDPTPIPAPFAFGSGEEFALAIMTFGGTAKDAIRVAEELDLYTGGVIRVLAIPGKK
jgi:ATP-dependent protease HslVU (ClpYQ) peptidase subunit